MGGSSGDSSLGAGQLIFIGVLILGGWGLLVSLVTIARTVWNAWRDVRGGTYLSTSGPIQVNEVVRWNGDDRTVSKYFLDLHDCRLPITGRLFHALRATTWATVAYAEYSRCVIEVRGRDGDPRYRFPRYDRAI